MPRLTKRDSLKIDLWVPRIERLGDNTSWDKGITPGRPKMTQGREIPTCMIGLIKAREEYRGAQGLVFFGGRRGQWFGLFCFVLSLLISRKQGMLFLEYLEF